MKKYCNTCGAIIRERARKCPKCGVKFNRSINYSTIDYNDLSTHKIEPYKKKSYQEEFDRLPFPQIKNKGVALILAFILPGTGLIYAGNWVKGIKILGSFVIFTTIDLIIKIGFQYWGLVFLAPIFYPTMIIWSIVSTNNQFKSHMKPSDKYTKQI